LTREGHQDAQVPAAEFEPEQLGRRQVLWPPDHRIGDHGRIQWSVQRRQL
jgi:hypothetical protein